MAYKGIGFALGLSAGLWAISIGDPHFFTAEHLETITHHLATDRLLPGDQLQQKAAAGSAHGASGETASESYSNRVNFSVEPMSYR